MTIKSVNTLRSRKVDQLTLHLLLLLFVLTSVCGSKQPTNSIIEDTVVKYYIDSNSGNDNNDGLTPESAWKTLKKASSLVFKPGNSILLRRGSRFNGTLLLQATGSDQFPVIVDAYGNCKKPIIDAAGYEAGVHIINSNYVEVQNLEIISDGGDAIAIDGRKNRYGVLVEGINNETYRHFHLKNLDIHDIFASESVPSEGMNPTSNMGMGIAILARSDGAKLSDILIEGCKISRTGH